MKILIAEDDFVSRKLLFKILLNYGECDCAINGKEAIEAFLIAHKEGTPYDIICLDIMMPIMYGQEVLKKIRNEENKMNIFATNSVKIVMTTALNDSQNILKAFREQCEGYITKPIRKTKIEEMLKKLELI